MFADAGSLILHMAGYAAFFVVLLVSLFLIPVGLPGTFLIAAAFLVFSLVAGTSAMTWWTFAVLLGLAVLGEIIESGAGFVGARRAKGSYWSSLGALFGGLAGALIGTVFGLVGAIPGALLGTFAGAFAVEYRLTRQRDASMKVAGGALLGRVIGSLTKLTIGAAMVCLIVVVLVVRAVSP